MRRSEVRIITPRTWLVCFVSASLLGVTLAWQRWNAWRTVEKPGFWSAEYLQPAMIPWYAWALIAPVFIMALHQAASASMTRSRRVAIYGGLAALAIAVHTIVSAFALGWWWAFPNPIPVDPAWHIMDLLRNRVTMSVLVVWVIAATFFATRRSSEAATLPATPAPVPDPVVSPIHSVPSGVSGTIALKAADRVWLVNPADITWVAADGDYVVVHTSSKRHRIRETISAFEQRVPPGDFIRVSRSAIVNLSAIQEVQRWFRGNLVIILRDGAKVTTGSRYRDRLTGRIPL
jgi:DNA-binding LytR/AlgR family response regulator